MLQKKQAIDKNRKWSEKVLRFQISFFFFLIFASAILQSSPFNSYNVSQKTSLVENQGWDIGESQPWHFLNLNSLGNIKNKPKLIFSKDAKVINSQILTIDANFSATLYFGGDRVRQIYAFSFLSLVKLPTIIHSVSQSVSTLFVLAVFVVLLCFVCLSHLENASFNPSLQKIKRRSIFC